jgi:hypothetical protein
VPIQVQKRWQFKGKFHYRVAASGRVPLISAGGWSHSRHPLAATVECPVTAVQRAYAVPVGE